MKKKIVSICLVAVIAVMAIAGASLAYFTDEDKAENVFTTGNVDITLLENFGDNKPETLEKLMPGKQNAITKEVTVKNNGSEDAYVRVHIAIPAMLDSGTPELAAYNNTLHWNFTKEAVQEGQWSQLQNKEQVGPNDNYPNWPGNGGAYNTYTTKVDGIAYNVYVITYETALKKDETTATPAISQVYLDEKVTNAQMDGIIKALEGNIKVLVFAEGGQKAGFDDAYTALNTQFGTPGSEGYAAPWNK